MSTVVLALLFPVLLVQGLLVRRRVLRLPEASGPTSGSVPGPDPLRLLVLGESTAAGVGAATHAAALTGQLAVALGRGVRWRVIGRSGLTASAARGLVPRPLDADVVVVVLGVNDTKNLVPVRRWRTDLLRLIIAIGDVPVVLTGVPPMDAFPSLPQPLRLLLGLRSRELDAAAASLPRVTHLPMPRELLTPELFCEDGFHPSEAGYRLWAGSIAESGKRANLW
jgi:lysophospholipase L1-like esterase